MRRRRGRSGEGLLVTHTCRTHVTMTGIVKVREGSGGGGKGGGRENICPKLKMT